MMPDLRFVLVRSRSPGNVGSVARAMKNFGFGDLCLVDPRLNRDHDVPGSEPYFEREARRLAWHASDVLDSAKVVDKLEDALAPCGLVLATAPRAYRGVLSLSPEEGADRLAAALPDRPALVFGSESSGLTLEEMARCSGVVVIPTDPAYRDLNLAQSAVLMAYLTFRRSVETTPPRRAESPRHADLEGLADMLCGLADEVEFLRGDKDPMTRELRAMLHRWDLSRRDTELIRSFIRRIRPRLSQKDSSRS
jgi:TrmH family RNA methyltransferase